MKCEGCEHEWVVFSTALNDHCLMVECAECHLGGIVPEPSQEEWEDAFNAPSSPYRWEDNFRVVVPHDMRQGGPPYVQKTPQGSYAPSERWAKIQRQAKEDSTEKGGDSPHVTMWKSLLYLGCLEAAAGLIRDVFSALTRIEQQATDAEGEHERETARASAAHLREDAMFILADEDGTKLKEWLALYRQDTPRWTQCVDEWVALAREGDVFHLFD